MTAQAQIKSTFRHELNVRRGDFKYPSHKEDFENPEKFVVRGADLMQLEQTLYKFWVYQTDKPLVSLQFLAQMSV